MGNDSSLPSLDRMGRPFGTGRLPNSFARQVDRQLETGVPVERLEGRQEAGGARRARKNEQPGTHRGRRGPRAEEVRAERQAAGKTSRRQEEASSRSRRSGKAQPTAAATSGALEKDDAGRGTRDFGTELRAKAETAPKARSVRSQSSGRPEAAAAAAAKSELPSVVTAGQPPLMAAPPQTAPQQSPAGTALPAAKSSGSLVAQSSLAPATELSGKPEAKTDVSEAAKPEQAQRWSESEAAERASAVLRQLRVHMNPALRSATVQLAPADLGRLSIKLRVQDGSVHAEVRAESAETLSILERHLPELQASLASHGLEAESFELMLGMGDEGQGASDRSATSEQTSTSGESSGDLTIEPELLARAVARRAGLDTYA